MDEVTTTKMEGPGQVTLKDPKKVAAGRRLAKYNCRKREELAQVTKAQKSESESKLTLSQYYGTGAVIALGVLGVLGYYIHQSKKGDISTVTKVTPVRSSEPQTHKFEME